MYHEFVRIYRSIERRYQDPANNDMSIPRSVALADKLGLKISRDNCPEYPAGSMFWGKASIVARCSI